MSTKFSVLLLTVLLTACGGGGGSGDDSTAEFSVFAANDHSVSEGEAVSFTARAFNATGDVTYTWQVSPTLEYTLDTTGATLSFTAPVVEQNTSFTFTLTGVDTDGTSDSDVFVITVEPESELPVASVTVADWPDLDSGVYPAGVSILLDGRASYDAIEGDPDTIAVWQWQQDAGTNVMNGLETNKPTLTIVTPETSSGETLQFTLVVTDDEGDSDSATVSIQILSISATQPTADAGNNQYVYTGESILLNGSADSSVSTAYPLSVGWSYSADVPISIDQANVDQTFAIAPAVSEQETVQFVFTVTDAYGNEVSDIISVIVMPYPTPLWNDTGVAFQANNAINTADLVYDWPGQDGQKGADVIATNNAFEKAGRGEAGFDFTKLNANGDEADAATTDFRCVRDNTTGLVWEVKNEDITLHNPDNTYSWYASTDNGGYVGDLNGTDTTCSLTNCNTEAFVNAVNAAGLCGFYDWRLPNHMELLSIVHFGGSDGMKLDMDYFPYAGDPDADVIWYWTAQPGADGVSNNAAQNAWAIDFISGVDNFLNKSSAAHVRLVRAGR